MATPRGVFPLKYFFQPKVNTTAGERVAAATVKRNVAALIHAEDKLHPYSDLQLSRLLKARGFITARRTIAKYREELAIPPSPSRRVPN